MTLKIVKGLGIVISVFALIGIIVWLLVAKEIESVREMYNNETNQSMELVVYRARTDGEPKDKTEITLTNQGLRQIKRGRKGGVPECAYLPATTGREQKWINLTGIMVMRNGEWHETPTVREYRITDDIEHSDFCENKYAE